MILNVLFLDFSFFIWFITLVKRSLIKNEFFLQKIYTVKMKAFRYGQSLGKETISSEYKEFSFYHSGIPYDKKEITEFLTSFRWGFNDLVSK